MHSTWRRRGAVSSNFHPPAPEVCIPASAARAGCAITASAAAALVGPPIDQHRCGAVDGPIDAARRRSARRRFFTTISGSTFRRKSHPSAKTGASRKLVREPACLEAAHLSRRRRAGHCGPAANDPAHRRFVPKPLSVVYVFVAGEAAKHGLAEQSRQGVPPVRVSARVGGASRT